MRNAFGLMLASVVSAVVIAAFWFWTSPPRAEGTAPQTVAARPAEKLPAAVAAKPVPDVTTTASLSDKPAAPAPRKSSCANADALGVTGWVHNCRDGSVEAHVEGDEGAVGWLIEAMRSGPSGAGVDDLTFETATVEQFNTFEARS